MFCSRCGKETAAGARFCGQCGEPLEAAATASAVPSGRDSSVAEGVSAQNPPGGTGPSTAGPPASGAAGVTGSRQAAGAGWETPAAGTQTGLQRNLAGLLCYVLGWLTGIIFYLVEKDPFIRFHAVQSILTFGAFTAFYILISILIPLGLWRLWFLIHTLNTLVWLASIVL
ncbi:MAG: zinc-ribbon domain-containing protein, partial [Desulfotomaculales bacterium]